MINTNCKILGLSQDEIKQFNKVKNAFRTKMIENSLNKQKRTQLIVAYYDACNQIFHKPNKENNKAVQFMIKADFNSIKELLNINPSLKNKLLGKFSIVYYSVMSGHQDMVQFLLKAGCAIQIDGQKSTALHCAAYYGHKHLIPLLLSYGAPIAKKNFAQNTPFDEAATDEIKQLLKQIQENRFIQLKEKLLTEQLTKNIINIKRNNVTIIRKILLNNYLDDFSNYKNAFHGTKYQSLLSIAKHGLKMPGETVQGKTIVIRVGHIGSRVVTQSAQRQQEEFSWGKAIFVSPSIYYSTNLVYSEQVIIQNQKWLPFLQVKVKKGSFSKTKSTVKGYKLKNDQPVNLQYRVGPLKQFGSDCQIQFQNQKQNEKKRVIVVAVSFIKKQFLDNQQNFNEVTDLILNSQQEKVFRSYAKK